MSPRTALVTGATSGIGRAIALALGRRGHRVLALGRDAAALAALGEELARAGVEAVPVLADLARPGFEEALGEPLASVDVLVHNASYFPPYAAAERTAAEDLERMVAVGLTSALALVRGALPGMKARGFGRFVAIGSITATLGGQGQAAYAAVKAGLGGLVRVIAAEASRRGVTANLLELGLIDTERMRSVVTPEVRAQLLARTPAGRFGTPEEVAAVVAFICSEEAGYLTGATIPVAGGLGLGLLPPAGV
ncbi:MAG TPA: SDR family NAD(P)-dependent oxidoreductase [Thermoanaerobaculia bacterium]|nr:SDR family NAD(P)-dependent oxidoreductase [Thermoanaerobaculia bacterium]